MKKRKKQRRVGLGAAMGTSDTELARGASSWYLDAVEFAEKASKESVRENCGAALTSLEHAHEFYGNGSSYARLLKKPMATKTSWGKRRADAQDALKQARSEFRNLCVLKG